MLPASAHGQALQKHKALGKPLKSVSHSLTPVLSLAAPQKSHQQGGTPWRTQRMVTRSLQGDHLKVAWGQLLPNKQTKPPQTSTQAHNRQMGTYQQQNRQFLQASSVGVPLDRSDKYSNNFLCTPEAAQNHMPATTATTATAGEILQIAGSTR